jgi:hypothetical protein
MLLNIVICSTRIDVSSYYYTSTSSVLIRLGLCPQRDTGSGRLVAFYRDLGFREAYEFLDLAMLAPCHASHPPTLDLIQGTAAVHPTTSPDLESL